MELKYEEEGFLSPSRIILFSFLTIVALLLGKLLYLWFIYIYLFFLAYLYFANLQLIKSGQHNPKIRLKKRDMTNWSYGD